MWQLLGFVVIAKLTSYFYLMHHKFFGILISLSKCGKWFFHSKNKVIFLENGSFLCLGKHFLLTNFFEWPKLQKIWKLFSRIIFSMTQSKQAVLVFHTISYNIPEQDVYVLLYFVLVLYNGLGTKKIPRASIEAFMITAFSMTKIRVFCLIMHESCQLRQLATPKNLVMVYNIITIKLLSCFALLPFITRIHQIQFKMKVVWSCFFQAFHIITG